MPSATEKRQRAARLRSICRALPAAQVRARPGCLVFEAGGKVFAYYLDDHHGDGITSLACKVLSGELQSLVAASPRKFYLPAYIGPRGWVGLRLDRPTLDWNEVRELVEGSYRLCAPPRLLRRIAEDGGAG